MRGHLSFRSGNPALTSKTFKNFTPTSENVMTLDGTVNKIATKKTYLNYRNNLVMLLKNLPIYDLYIIIFRLLLDGIAALKYIYESKFGHCFAIIKAHFAFYIKIPNILINSKRIQRIDSSIKYKNSILIDYYIKGNKLFKELRL